MSLPSLAAAECAERIRRAKSVVALTGAGISTAAGIPDFRGPKGLYVTRRYDPETVFDIDYFRRDPAPFFAFSRDFLGLLETVRPSFTHRFLAALERAGTLRAVVTQNIDLLHERAGSVSVIAVHGNYVSGRCLDCGQAVGHETLRKKILAGEIPRCSCGGVEKPDVVFFGEAVRGMAEAGELVAACDVLLVLGSSLAVYPAAMLPRYARGTVVVVNRGEVSLSPGRERYQVEADLDDFFLAVAKELALKVNP